MARPEVNQIYPLVNSIFKQMTGRSDIEVVDNTTLVSLGQEVNNLGLNDLWLNALARRIGKTIDDNRVYRNKFSDLYRDDMAWGAIVQKLRVEMPDAVKDDMYEVGQLDGQSLDQYVINNPKATQKFFDKEAPYSFFITMQDKFLREAFLSEGAMGAFVNQIFTKVRNKIEVTLEDLARLAVNTYMLNAKPAQVYNLVTMYNKTFGTSLTSEQAWYDDKFLRFAISKMNSISEKMESMSVLYNGENVERFTPQSQQRFYALADFKQNLGAFSQYAAFHERFISKNADVSVPYWQAVKEGDDVNSLSVLGKVSGKVTGSKGTEEKTLTNVVGIIFDYDAIGTHRIEERVLTTPVNARGAYYNTYWHENQLWFNDLSENGVIFTLN